LAKIEFVPEEKRKEIHENFCAALESYLLDRMERAAEAYSKGNFTEFKMYATEVSEIFSIFKDVCLAMWAKELKKE